MAEVRSDAGFFGVSGDAMSSNSPADVVDREIDAALTHRPAVAIVIPTLNEEHYIEACLASLLPQAMQLDAEMLVVDGGSTDATVALVEAMAHKGAPLRLLHNPRRVQSAAVNLGAQESAAKIIVRADAHAEYDPDFLRACLMAMAEHHATSVVVPMRTVGLVGFQRAVAAAQNSLLGNGGSPHRTLGVSRVVDHGHHAAFDREFFLAVGGYDENFTHNEDAEFDLRARRAGARIWLCREASVSYFPRSGPAKLARQYYRHGRGRAQTLCKHRVLPGLRQMAPVAALFGTVGGLALMSFDPYFALVPCVYVVVCTGWGARGAALARDPWRLAMGPAAMIMHLSWGWGFVSTILRACAGLLAPRRAKIRSIAPDAPVV